MAYSRARFSVVTNGQTLVVQVTVGGTALAFYSDAALTSQITAPVTISADTTYYVAEDGYGPYVISCKQLDGTELYGKGATKQQLVNGLTVEPLPSRAQVAADVSSLGNLALAPTGALAETTRRDIAVGNSAAITSGVLTLTAIPLRAGTVVTNITYMSASTALSAGTNQWFALYTSARALLAQTADDTSTAWGTNATKTLALTSPYTITASGLYYIGINVTASTVPTLRSAAVTSNLTGLTPILSGTSTTTLTDTAPPTAAAITAAAVLPYAYVS